MINEKFFIGFVPHGGLTPRYLTKYGWRLTKRGARIFKNKMSSDQAISVFLAQYTNYFPGKPDIFFEQVKS